MATPLVPIGQTDEQRAASIAASGQQPDGAVVAYSATGKDVFGNPVKSAGGTAAVTGVDPALAPIKRTVDGSASDAAQTFLDTFTAPKTAAQIAEEKRQQSAGLIDGINKNYDTQVADAAKSGQERVSMDNAVSVLSGLTGSTEAVRTRTNVNAANDKEIAAINNKRLVDLSKVYTDISTSAEAEAHQQLQDATANAKDIVARRAAAQTKALDQVKTLASGGLVDFESFKNSPQNKGVYDYALQAAGGSEDNLRAIFAMNRPKDQLVGTPQRVGDHFVQAYSNPITGKVSYDTINIPGGIPPEYKSFQKIGDSKTGEFLYAIPENWDGDQSKLKLIASTKGVGDGTGGASGYNGDFAATIDLAGQQGGTNQERSQIKTNLQKFIAAKDYPSAYAAIADATAKGLKGTAATTFHNQSTSLYVLDSLEKAVKAYAAQGGDTNILKGTEDQIQTRIGQLYTDPKYATLATQLDSAFQQYRLNMTGAAFGAQESREYASVLPGKGNSLDLNLAKLTGAKNYLNSSVEGAIKSIVGPGGVYIKQYAEGATRQGGDEQYTSAQSAAVGATVTIDGVQYKKTGNDQYEPI